MEKEGNMIDEWLDQNRNQEIEQFIEKNLAITEKVNAVLKEKGWTQTFFAKEILDKKPSEVSRWLSGMHNLTLKSIIKMEMALGVDLIQTQPSKQSFSYAFAGMIEHSMAAEEKVEYTTTIEGGEYVIAM